MKRSSKKRIRPLRRVSPKRAERRIKAKLRFADAHGVCFDELTHAMLWPVVHRVDSQEVLDEYRFNPICFWCERRFVVALDAHHIVGGSAGRSDEKCNLMSLCRECHSRLQSDSSKQPKMLGQKWKHDRWNCDWRRLCELAGKVFSFSELEFNS